MATKHIKEIDKSNFLCNTMEQSIKNNFIHLKEIPDYVLDNLSSRFEIRDYQEDAIRYAITYLEANMTSQTIEQVQLLFHMATGSGKTYVMAAMMLYMYKLGYRNFIFFVNHKNIVEKTKENFLNKSFEKYLFRNSIVIDGQVVEVKPVENFQDCNKDAINIKFTTTQQLHLDLIENKENKATLNEFENIKVIMIADEAHHINADTKKKLTEDEQLEQESWEKSVGKILTANNKNMLFEFTATCDFKNEEIYKKYTNRIIYDYPILKFREDGYTKEFLNLQSNLSPLMRVVQAMLLSQYRLKLFEKHNIYAKPTILLKSKGIDENKEFYKNFINFLKYDFSINDICYIRGNSKGIVKKMFDFFIKEGISDDILVQELKDAFSEEHLIIMDSKDKDISKKHKIVNDLENLENPYRMIFTVDMLNEGWDVLNLFDIVRLYDERQGGKKISKTTTTEAQMIGRGVRYFPFKISDDDEKHKRKYDLDIDNELRICETLYYHCKQDSKYIDELRRALKEIGLEPENIKEFNYLVKEEFISNPIYETGAVFVNDYIKKDRSIITGIPDEFNCNTEIDLRKNVKEISLVSENVITKEKMNSYTKNYKIKDIAQNNLPILLKAARRYPIMKFSNLKHYFPKLDSITEFLKSEEYAGRFELTLIIEYEKPNNIDIYLGVMKLFGKLSSKIASIKDEYEGTTTFIAKPLKEFVRDTPRKKMNPDDEGEGVSQNASTVSEEYRLNLSDKEWFVYMDNYGTTEEKKFVKYFSNKVGELKSKYNEIYLIRNERNLKIYSFSKGRQFEPDYILLLRKKNEEKFLQQQIFIEPKGKHLIKEDIWKEEFLLEIESKAQAVVYNDDNDYRIIGLPFYNEDVKLKQFTEAFEKILDDTISVSDVVNEKEVIEELMDETSQEKIYKK